MLDAQLFKRMLDGIKLTTRHTPSPRVVEKRCYDVMLSRQEGSTTRHLASAQHWDWLAGGNTGRLFLTFGGPVCADRISYCPLDRVLTYKILIYVLNL